MKKFLKVLIVATLATVIALLAVGCAQQVNGKTYKFSEVKLTDYDGASQAAIDMWESYYENKTVEFKEDGTILMEGYFNGYYLQKGGDIFVSQSKDNFDTLTSPSYTSKGDSVTFTFKTEDGTVNVIFKLK